MQMRWEMPIQHTFINLMLRLFDSWFQLDLFSSDWIWTAMLDKYYQTILSSYKIQGLMCGNVS